MPEIATIILNRNLPEITDKLYTSIKKNNNTDIFVVEAGSLKNRLSKHVTWHANWKSAKKNGLRFPRGMNFALSKLYLEKKLDNYKYFALITNDAEFKTLKFCRKVSRIFEKHKKLGILSPIANNFGEKKLLKDEKVKYFWYVHNHVLFIRKELIKTLMCTTKPNHMNFLFDGTNFRGYGTEMELVAKAYSNYWSVGLTSNIIVNENERLLLKQSNIINTESYDKNLKLFVLEGKKWMKNKYGFDSKWSMSMYAKLFYDKFFDYYPELIKFKI
jgi:hypothetical protein